MLLALMQVKLYVSPTTEISFVIAKFSGLPAKQPSMHRQLTRQHEGKIEVHTQDTTSPPLYTSARRPRLCTEVCAPCSNAQPAQARRARTGSVPFWRLRD